MDGPVVIQKKKKTAIAGGKNPERNCLEKKEGVTLAVHGSRSTKGKIVPDGIQPRERQRGKFTREKGKGRYHTKISKKKKRGNQKGDASSKGVKKGRVIGSVTIKGTRSPNQKEPKRGTKYSTGIGHVKGTGVCLISLLCLKRRRAERKKLERGNGKDPWEAYSGKRKPI